MPECKVCSAEFDNFRKLSKHIRDRHTTHVREYYDAHVKLCNEGVCRYCKNACRFISLSAGYNDTCNSTACKSCYMRDIRQINKKDLKKHEAFVNKVSANQKRIWEDRKHTGVDTQIRNQISNTRIRNISTLSPEERKEKFGWMSKLSDEERKTFVKKILLSTGMHAWWKNATNEEKKRVIEKRNLTRFNLTRELLAEYNNNKENKEKYYEIVRYLTAQTYFIHKREIDPAGVRGNHYHLDHKYSIIRGFINKVPPEIIASKYNLKIIPSGENLKKGPGCSISLDVLLREYNE